MINIRTEVKQNQTITQQQIQSLNVLSMASEELFDYVREIAESNCVVDIDALYENRTPGKNPIIRELNKGWRVSRNNEEQISPIEMIGEMDESLQSFLRQQVNDAEFSEFERKILYLLIKCVNDDGRISEADPVIRRLRDIAPKDYENMLVCLQKLEPAGVGARSLEESIKLQLCRMIPRNILAEEIVDRHMEFLSNRDFIGIVKKTGASKKEVFAAYELIKSIDPYPCRGFSRERAELVIPDLLIYETEDGFVIEVNNYSVPSVKIDSNYDSDFADDADIKNYLAGQYKQAKLLKKCIEQRGQTLTEIGKCIFRHQYLFFVNGDRSLSPLRQKEVADELGIHESTVSRAIRNKTIQCRWGVYPIKYFFQARQQCEEGAINPLYVIKEIIGNEDKRNPVSDEEIACRLTEMGVPISRRTVSKYRSELGIMSAKKRKSKFF